MSFEKLSHFARRILHGSTIAILQNAFPESIEALEEESRGSDQQSSARFVGERGR